MRLLLLSIVWCFSLGAAELPTGVNHNDWTALLQTYVDAHGQVDYQRWRSHSGDTARLQVYVAQFAQISQPMASGAERNAGLLNAYNAFTIQEVLALNPTGSFWDHKPFKIKKYIMGGDLVSLDEIQYSVQLGYLVHAGLVCAAASCPPMLAQAYLPDSLQAQLHERMKLWLATPHLNQFDSSTNTIAVSKIFEWYANDYGGADQLPQVLAPYAPESHREWLNNTKVTITYLEYDTALNQSRMSQAPEE